MPIKLGDHVAFGTNMKLREGVVVNVSHGGGAMLVTWSDGGQTVIATGGPPSHDDAQRPVEVAHDTSP